MPRLQLITRWARSLQCYLRAASLPRCKARPTTCVGIPGSAALMAQTAFITRWCPVPGRAVPQPTRLPLQLRWHACRVREARQHSVEDAAKRCTLHKVSRQYLTKRQRSFGRGVLRREPGDDFLKARIAAKRIPVRVQFKKAVVD